MFLRWNMNAAGGRARILDLAHLAERRVDEHNAMILELLDRIWTFAMQIEIPSYLYVDMPTLGYLG